jgi:hypothetical protein
VSESEFLSRLDKMKKEMAGKEGAAEKIAKKETYLAKEFKAKDTNKDGSLSLEEFSAAPVKKDKKAKGKKEKKDQVPEPEEE